MIRGETTEQIDTFNPKYEFITLQNKVKALLSAPAQDIFSSNKEAVKVPEVQIFQQGSLQLEGVPEKVFAKG